MGSQTTRRRSANQLQALTNRTFSDRASWPLDPAWSPGSGPPRHPQIRIPVLHDAELRPERIETWPLAKLQPYAANPKAHDDDQVAKLAASMAEFGWTVPCLVAEDGELIAGHGRVLAATRLGLTEAPVIVLGHLSEAQRRAYRIADNKLTELGSWDQALLSGELQSLLADDFDLSLVGFSDGELDKLLAFDPETTEEIRGQGIDAAADHP